MDSLQLRHQGSPEPLFMLMISMPSPPPWSPSFQVSMGCGTPSFLLHACFLGMCLFCLVLLFILSLIAACLIQVCRLCSSLWKIYPHICVVFPVVTSVLSSYKYYFWYCLGRLNLHHKKLHCLEMQIKNTIRYHLTPLIWWLHILKNPENRWNKCWLECEEIGILMLGL